jgi:cytochrome c556
MNKSGLFLLSLCALSFSVPAAAQFAKAEDAIKYRQSALFVMQQNFGRVGAMVQGKAPFDPKLAVDSAATAEYMSKLPWAAFVDGSDKGDTKAKDDIWTNRPKFNQYAEKMQSEMSKLSASTKTGSLDNIKVAFMAAGASCKACHDEFRSK